MHTQIPTWSHKMHDASSWKLAWNVGQVARNTETQLLPTKTVQSLLALKCDCVDWAMCLCTWTVSCVGLPAAHNCWCTWAKHPMLECRKQKDVHCSGWAAHVTLLLSVLCILVKWSSCEPCREKIPGSAGGRIGETTWGHIHLSLGPSIAQVMPACPKMLSSQCRRIWMRWARRARSALPSFGAPIGPLFSCDTLTIRECNCDTFYITQLPSQYRYQNVCDVLC